MAVSLAPAAIALALHPSVVRYSVSGQIPARTAKDVESIIAAVAVVVS